MHARFTDSQYVKFVRNSYEIRTNFVRISYEFRTNLPSFPLFRFPTAQAFFAFSLTMSQQTMSQLASLASRPDPAADTLAHYQALPVAHHQLEEAT